VEEQRKIRAEPGLPADPEAGTGILEALEQRAGLAALGVEGDAGAAGEDGDVGACIGEEGGRVDCGGPGTEDGDFAAVEGGEIAVVEGVADVLRGDIGEGWWDVGMPTARTTVRASRVSPDAVVRVKPLTERPSEVMSVGSSWDTRRRWNSWP